MALSATLTNADALITASGMTLRYTVLIADDTLGSLGVRTLEVSDPAVIANVAQYVAAMLPTIEAHVGLPVTLPEAPAPQPEPEEGN